MLREIQSLSIGLSILAGLTVAGVVGVAGTAMSSCGTAESPPEPTTSTSTTTYVCLDYTFTLPLEMPRSASLYSTYLVPWTSAVEKASHGRVVIEMAELGGFPKEEGTTLRDVRQGRADLALLEPEWIPGGSALLELASLPMLFPDTEVAARVTLQLIEEYGEGEFEGLHVLGFMTTGLYQYAGKAPVREPADFRGLTVRTGSDLENEVVAALGAMPRDARSVPALQTTYIEFDGLFLPWPFHAANTNRYATYWTSCDLFLRPLLLVMNEDKWNSLPAAVQQVFAENSGAEASVKYLADDAKYNYDNSLMPDLRDKGWDYLAVEERASELGHPIYVLSDAERAEWREAVRPVWDKWLLEYASVLRTTYVLDRALELIEEYSAE